MRARFDTDFTDQRTDFTDCFHAKIRSCRNGHHVEWFREIWLKSVKSVSILIPNGATYFESASAARACSAKKSMKTRIFAGSRLRWG